jgi:hypothetical protein
MSEQRTYPLHCSRPDSACGSLSRGLLCRLRLGQLSENIFRLRRRRGDLLESLAGVEARGLGDRRTRSLRELTEGLAGDLAVVSKVEPVRGVDLGELTKRCDTEITLF